MMDDEAEDPATRRRRREALAYHRRLTDDIHVRRESGGMTTADPLVRFLYVLMRDRMPPGKVDELVMRSEPEPTELTNGWLARFAEYLADVLRGPSDAPSAAPPSSGTGAAGPP